MGALTRAQIISEGILLGQRDDAGTVAIGWLQRWLDAVAASWPWPDVQREAVGIALPTPSLTGLILGNGMGGITERINKVKDNTWIYTTGGQNFFRVRIKNISNQPQDRIGPTGAVGTPQQIRVFKTGDGKWTLYFYPNPDKAYLLSVAYWAIPAAMTADTDIPWYPNDETMVQAVAFKTHEFYDGKDSPLTLAAQQLLSQAIANDRIRYGSVTGTNDVIQLDPARFRRAKAP